MKPVKASRVDRQQDTFTSAVEKHLPPLHRLKTATTALDEQMVTGSSLPVTWQQHFKKRAQLALRRCPVSACGKLGVEQTVGQEFQTSVPETATSDIGS